MTEKTWKNQEELKRFLTEEVLSGRAAGSRETVKAALRECTDDEFLYLFAENVPWRTLAESAAAAVKSGEYRYAVICSSLTGRRTLIHDLAVSRELDERLAARILLTDPETETKRESLYCIRSEALLMLAFLQSFSYRTTARERLRETGSEYPERYYAMTDPDERKRTVREWYAEACAFARSLIETDREMNEKLSMNVDIDSEPLIGFLAACHPDPAERADCAKRIRSERLAAYVGAVTEDAEVRRILSRKIHREDLLCELPVRDSSGEGMFLIPGAEERYIPLCMEILRNTDREETRRILKEQMEDAGFEVPAEL